MQNYTEIRWKKAHITSNCMESEKKRKVGKKIQAGSSIIFFTTNTDLKKKKKKKKPYHSPYFSRLSN